AQAAAGPGSQRQPPDGWRWDDPFGDCGFTWEGGLVLRAANERDLDVLNRGAPRLLRRIDGAFAVETVCVPVSPEQPAIGGLLLWEDEANYLRLDRGARGPGEITFRGSVGNQEMYFGRGSLAAERLWLRLERVGEQVEALCSMDGQQWWQAGVAAFPV